MMCGMVHVVVVCGCVRLCMCGCVTIAVCHNCSNN